MIEIIFTRPLIIYNNSELYKKMTVLSIFVKDSTKSQLQQMVPGLTIWRIDQARKHAAVVGAGVNEERQSVVC